MACYDNVLLMFGIIILYYKEPYGIKPNNVGYEKRIDINLP